MWLLSLSISAGYSVRLTFGFASLTTKMTTPLPFSKDHITTLLQVLPMAWEPKDLRWVCYSSSFLSITSSMDYYSIQVLKLLLLSEIRAHEQNVYRFTFLVFEQVCYLWSLHSIETDIFLDIFERQQLLLLEVLQWSC